MVKIGKEIQHTNRPDFPADYWRHTGQIARLPVRAESRRVVVDQNSDHIRHHSLGMAAVVVVVHHIDHVEAEVADSQVAERTTGKEDNHPVEEDSLGHSRAAADSHLGCSQGAAAEAVRSNHMAQTSWRKVLLIEITVRGGKGSKSGTARRTRAE